jgi:glycosyltransferase involved in cell wall biosynthesis
VRILYVQPADMVGGAERQGVVQIRGLRELGVEVVPVIGGPEVLWLRGQLEKAGVQDYVVLEQFPHVSTKALTVAARVTETLGNLKALIFARNAVEKLARHRQVDAVVANCVHGWVTTGNMFRRGNIPLIWRAGTRMGAPAQKVGLRLVASVLKPSAVLPNCEALQREIGPLVGCPTEIVPNGIDSRRFDPATAVPRFRDGHTRVVGIVTRPQPEKGMDLLADVIARLAARVPDVQVLIAGDGYRRAEFAARFRERGLGSHANFIGHVDDIESFYASCDVMILTSRSLSAEASSNALLEAMAMERPVVATRVAGLPEMIEDGREGWLVGENDADGFAEKIALLLGDAELRRRMGRAGREQVLGRFAEKAAVRKLHELLTECRA